MNGVFYNVKVAVTRFRMIAFFVTANVEVKMLRRLYACAYLPSFPVSFTFSRHLCAVFLIELTKQWSNSIQGDIKILLDNIQNDISCLLLATRTARDLFSDVSTKIPPNNGFILCRHSERKISVMLPPQD